MDLVSYQRCTVNGPYIEVEVPSESSDTVYTLLITDPKDPSEAICDCRAFRFSTQGTCKHQQVAIDCLCEWSGLTGPETQTQEERRNKICPRCGGPTEWKMADAEL